MDYAATKNDRPGEPSVKSFSELVALTALVVVLVGIPVSPEAASIVAIAVMAASVPLFVYDLRHGLRLTRGHVVTLVGAVALALALVPTTRSPHNYFVFLAVLPVAMAVPLASLFGRIQRRVGHQLICGLALCGTALAAAITAYDVLVRGVPRGGLLTMNPIHMGDLAILLGFLALSGTLVVRGPARFLYLLGPALALAATVCSGSRGPLAAYIVLGSFTVLFFVVIRLSKRHLWEIFVMTLLTIAASYLFLDHGGDQIAVIATGNAGAVDESTSIRLMLYQGAWGAFLDSPLFGHGGEGFITAAAAHVTQANIVGWEHLHADLADFAAIGGLMGLLSYFFFLAGPVISAWEKRANGYAGPYAAMASAGGVFAMGLTNAVIGILSLTVLFGVITAAVDAWGGASPKNLSFDRSGE